MTLNEDQQYFLSILRAVGCVRRDQVLPLLQINEPDKEELHADAQNDGERQKVQACLDRLEEHSRKAHKTVNFAYAPLPELYELQAA